MVGSDLTRLWKPGLVWTAGWAGVGLSFLALVFSGSCCSGPAVSAGSPLYWLLRALCWPAYFANMVDRSGGERAMAVFAALAFTSWAGAAWTLRAWLRYGRRMG